MKIVRAKLEDIPIIVKMKIEMFKENGVISLLQDNVENKIQQKYTLLYNEDKCCHFIAYDGDTVVAIGGAVIKDDVPFCFFRNPYYGYIIDIYCIPEKRRQGYATKIMESVLNWLEEKEIKTIKLKPSEKGRLMYEKMGFYNSGEMEKHN